jgi:hypothetical protein
MISAILSLPLYGILVYYGWQFDKTHSTYSFECMVMVALCLLIIKENK